MKNTIKYYYNIIPTQIHQKDDIYFFNINGKKYILMPFYGNIDNLNIIYNYLINLNIYCHEIIYNKDNHIITFINDKPYILLKVYYSNNQIITIQNILSYNILIKIDKKCPWQKLWCEKIDYYEFQIREFGKKYPIIRNSFGYYNGLCENAISLLNYLNLDKLNMYINHQRITKKMDLIDFYNPLNLIIDVKIRDTCEYFKIKFFQDEEVLEEINNYLYFSKLDYNEVVLFYIRLLYPSYYFDMYDKIIQGKEKEEKINIYIEKINDYEIFLKKIYIVINKYYKLPEIEWIIKT